MLMSLKSGELVVRHKFVILPMPDEAIEICNAIALRDIDDKMLTGPDSKTDDFAERAAAARILLENHAADLAALGSVIPPTFLPDRNSQIPLSAGDVDQIVDTDAVDRGSNPWTRKNPGQDLIRATDNSCPTTGAECRTFTTFTISSVPTIRYKYSNSSKTHSVSNSNNTKSYNNFSTNNKSNSSSSLTQRSISTRNSTSICSTNNKSTLPSRQYPANAWHLQKLSKTLQIERSN
jgi:hypothetical protein